LRSEQQNSLALILLSAKLVFPPSIPLNTLVPAAGVSVSIPERRKARRVALEIPVKVRLWESAVPEQKVECLNISERGVYFASGSRFNQGERLAVVLKMPEDIMGQGQSEWLCIGQVVRTQALDSTSLALGVAVQFEPQQQVRRLNAAFGTLPGKSLTP
jgi:hypothetical protein